MNPRNTAWSGALSRPRSSWLRWLSARWLRNDRPLLALFRSFGVQAFILVFNILTGVITARLLGPEGRGVYVAVTLWPPLLSTLAVAGLSSAVVFRMRKQPEAVAHIAAASLALGATHSLIAIGIGAALLPVFMAHYGAEVVLFAQMCLVNVLMNSAQSLIKQTFAGAGQYWYCNLTHLLPQLFHLLALLAIIPFATMTAHVAILALLASSGAAVLVMLPKFIRLARPRWRDSMAELRQLISYASRAAPTDVVFALACYSDRLVLIPLLPPRELGFYAVAFSFSRVIQFVQPALMSVFFSHMSAQSETDGRRLHDHACRFLAACLAGGCVLLWIFGQQLLVFAYGSEFSEAIAVFRLLIIEASLGALSQVTVQLFLSRNRPGVVSAIQMIVLGVSVAVLLVLVPRCGSMGAAMGLLAAGALRWLLLLGATKMILRQPLPRLYLTSGDLRYLLERLR